MPFPLAGLLTALKFAPAVLSAGEAVFEAVTGKDVPDAARGNPVALADEIAGLPEDQQGKIIEEIYRARAEAQAMDTARFLSMNDGTAEKIRATARPEIAKRAMGVVETFALVFKVVFFAIVLEWVARTFAVWVGAPLPETLTLPGMMAELGPVAEMIWAPLLGSFWACVEIIKKYMGVRERDKAHEYEMRNGGPLNSTAATIEAAGGGVASVIKAIRNR